MGDFVHCNKCLARPNKKPPSKFYVTFCRHLLCGKCKGDGPQDGPCKLCNKPTRTLEINRDLDKRLQTMFMVPNAFLAQRILSLRKQQGFQRAMFNNLHNFYQKQRGKLQQAAQHFQKQAGMVKVKDKAIVELKEQVTMLEQKLSLIETERDKLQKQIDELQKMETGTSSGLFDTPMDFTAQQVADVGSTSMFNFSHSFGDQEGFTTPGGSLNNSRNSDSVILALNSPCMSNSSILSEVTTPKILGLSKGKSPTSSSVFYPSLQTAPSEGNPYMNMFNRTATRNKTTPTACRTPSPFRMNSTNRSSSGHNNSNTSNTSGSFTGVVNSNIIPKTNTPSAGLMRF